MKKILLPFALLGFTAFAEAQDLSLKTLFPAAGTELKAGTERLGSITVDVVEDLPAGVSFALSYSINNGNEVEIVKGLGFQNAVPAGAEINPIQISFAVPTQVDDTFTLRVFVQYDQDTDHSNDTISAIYYTREKVADDIAVSILSPVNESKQKTWTTVPFVVKIKNVGTTNFNGNTPVILFLTVNGQVAGQPQIIRYTGTNLSPGDSGTVSLSINLPRNAPTGETNICVGYFWAEVDGQAANTIDGNSSDNIGCVTLNVVTNSINETMAQLNAVGYNNGHLNIELENKVGTNQYRFEITSVTGQTIATENVQASEYVYHNMAAQQINRGVYILSIYADDEFIGTEKFMVD
ncbi:MAG: hypothetical protein KDC92_02640 [Bacteroidetes bacterium]|nr:hypothetical protein [Bacteroidota bacterium]